MRIMKTCEICGSKYYTGNGKAKYCSDECKKEAAKRRHKKWREEHPDYHKEYHKEHPEVAEKFKESHPDYERDRWRKIRGSKEHTKICVVCGREFTTWNPNKKTCSDVCKDKNKKLRARIRDKRRSRKISYEENHIRWIRRRYGSEEAYQKYLAETEEKKKLNGEIRETEKKAKKEANHRFVECAVCGSTFETYNPRQKTCSKACSKKYSYARKDRRIPQEQMVDKDITLEALYRRDSGVCYLCGEKCDWNDRDLFAVRDKYPTIDHIIPISRGGLHSWDNVRLAHFKCNLDKSDDIIPEAKKMIPANAYEFKREVKPRKKKTLQFTKDNQFLTEYESTAEAERQTGIKQHGIQDCARGVCKSYGGFVWRYA